MSTGRRRTVLVTGASSGIGKATSLYLAGKGYEVIGTGRSAARLEPLKREASARNLPVTTVELDINSGEGVDRVLPGLLSEHGGVDALVNNAGYGLWGPLETLGLDQLKAQFETNLFGTVRLIKGVLPGMIERRAGTIVNVGSIAGRIATPFNAAYAASKFALEGMSEALRTEVWPFGVRVAVVEPGAVETSFLRNQEIGEGAESGNTVYGPFMERYRTRSKRFHRWAADPVKVAKVIHKVLRSRRPALRHPVGIDARAGMLGARLIPERLFQALVARATMR